MSGVDGMVSSGSLHLRPTSPSARGTRPLAKHTQPLANPFTKTDQLSLSDDAKKRREAEQAPEAAKGFLARMYEKAQATFKG